jgi:hypothetical protein
MGEASTRGDHLSDEQLIDRHGDLLVAAEAISASGHQVTLARLKVAIDGRLSESGISKVRDVFYNRGMWKWNIQVGAVNRGNNPEIASRRKYDYEPSQDEIATVVSQILGEWAVRAAESQKQQKRPASPFKTNSEACAFMIDEWKARCSSGLR